MALTKENTLADMRRWLATQEHDARRHRASARSADATPVWALEDDPLGVAFNAGGHGVHEIAAGAYGDHAAASGLAFALAGTLRDRHRPLIWVRTRALEREEGRLSGHGLWRAGLDPQRLACVAARDDREALWAVEETVVSGAAACVIAELGGADFTATRRLALRVRDGSVLLVLPPSCEGATAAQSRWRVSAHSSTPHAHDLRAPGQPRWRATLERSRNPSFAGHPQTYVLEQDHDGPDQALRLRVVSQLADPASEARAAQADDGLNPRKRRGVA